ncbi:MAG: VOC family protein [Caulobacteraceae bacterium]|nr:VOC family protein [Caulobacteraceae bacterium]
MTGPVQALDHVVVAVADLELATAAYETLLGRRAEITAPAQGARRAWVRLANMALEIIAPDGEGPAGDRVRAHLAGSGEGLMALAFSTQDLGEAKRVLARRGVTAEPSYGGALFATAEATSGVPMVFVEAASHPVSEPTAGAGVVQALDHVVINTPNPDRAVALYGARLGLDLRLDRSNPQWGSRLMFFRCDGAVVEVAASLTAPVSDAPDRLSGLAWRVAEPEAARERLAAAGFDVSEVRQGRKPGTHVFTVRSGAPGAPSLMLSADPALEEA